MEPQNWGWAGYLKQPQVTKMVSNSRRHTMPSTAQTPHCLASRVGMRYEWRVPGAINPASFRVGGTLSFWLVRLVPVLRCNAYPTASWVNLTALLVNLGWKKVSNGVTIKILNFSNILRLLVGVRKGIQPLKCLPNYKKCQFLVNLVHSNLNKTTTVGTSQKWSLWTGGRLIKHLYKTTRNLTCRFWQAFSVYFHCECFINNKDLLE